MTVYTNVKSSAAPRLPKRLCIRNPLLTVYISNLSLDSRSDTCSEYNETTLEVWDDISMGKNKLLFITLYGRWSD